MENPNSNYKNLASILLTNAGNSSDSTIIVDDTDAAVMPSVPFYATIMPTTNLANNTNSEIIYVTASSSSGGETTYTVSRGQRGTTAQSWDAGKAVMTQAVYTQDVQAQKQGYYNAVLSSGSAFTITNASAPTAPVIGSRISVVFDTAITTAATVTLAINGGTANTVAVSGVTFDGVGTLTTSITVASGKVYDLIYDGTEWVATNTFGKITSDNVDWTTLGAETIEATITVGGNAKTVTIGKVRLGGNVYMLTGIVYGTATSVAAGSRTSVNLTLPSSLGVTSCLGGAVSVYQNVQSASYTQYARIIPSSGNIDASCMCADSTNKIIWLNYVAIVVVAS